MKHVIRMIVPDSHGAHIDIQARNAFVRDVKRVRPQQIVWLGDHLDCGGTFSSHQRSYTNELCETYEDDCAAANLFIDMVMKAAPNAQHWYIEGNHEAHVERWAARNFQSRKDADKLLEVFGPWRVLKLREREIKYFRRSEHYQGLSIPGTIKLGKCFFTHGVSHGKHATHAHLERFGANVVHGHTHRAQSAIERTVSSDGHGAWCPGTLAKLQPLYKHTTPTSWSHGYGLQFVNQSSGRFMHFNVPIYSGESMLFETIDLLSHRRKAA